MESALISVELGINGLEFSWQLADGCLSKLGIFFYPKILDGNNIPTLIFPLEFGHIHVLLADREAIGTLQFHADLSTLFFLKAGVEIGTGGTGSYPWAISSTRAPGTNYRIRVTSVSQPTISGTSNGDFTITA